MNEEVRKEPCKDLGEEHARQRRNCSPRGGSVIQGTERGPVWGRSEGRLVMGAHLQGIVGCWELGFCPEPGGILEGFPGAERGGTLMLRSRAPSGDHGGNSLCVWRARDPADQEALVQTPDGGNCGGGTKWADSGWYRRWSWQVWV